MPETSPDQDALAALSALLGPRGLLRDGADTQPYCRDWRGLYQGRTAAVLRPGTAEELAQAVAICARHGVALVPQGGNTGLVGGGVPDASGAQMVLSTARLNRVRAVDPVDLTITVEAGVTLKAAQDAAAEAGCLLPLSISAEGTAQIGGVLATNAGGNNTLRYGNARDLVLGLEAVLPDGALWNGLRRLRKDNTGYCLRQLLVGSEGTLGVITAAVLKLVPRPAQRAVALCAVPTQQAVLGLFTRFMQDDPAALQAFEYMSGASMALVTQHIADMKLPLADPAPHYALVELATSRARADLRTQLEQVLEAALEDGLVQDAALAESEAQRDAMWKLREEHAEAQLRADIAIKNDVSVPVSRVPAFLAEADAACEALIPGIRIAPFGHMGDGNIHYNLGRPDGADRDAFMARANDIMDTVNSVVRKYDGSFSAEHGLGQLKSKMLPAWRGGAELDAMRRIKAALDPDGIMNPGKMLPKDTA